MTPAQIQTLIDACRTSPTDLVTWLELKAVLEALKNQDLGLTLTTTGTSGPATLDIDTDILNIPNYSTDLTVYVPYTGANQNVNLGEYGIRSGWYQFDLTPTGTPVSASTMYWDDNQKTVALVMGGTTQKVGHDQFYHAKNSTGTTIPKGTAVRFAGTDGGSGHLLITPFLADGSNPSSYFMGVTAEEITNGSFGKVQSFGRLDGIDTSAFAEGDILYASTTVAGGFQTTVPVAPNNIVQVAAVISDSNNGKLLIRPTLGSKLTSDESVKLTSVANGNVLQYNSTLSVWENVAPSSLAVSNIYTANGTLTGNRTVTMSGNNLIFSGGSSSSSERFQIAAATTMLARPANSSSTAYAVLYNEGVGYVGFQQRGSAVNVATWGLTGPSEIISVGTGGLVLAAGTGSGPIVFGTNNVERGRIFQNGNWGINTTTDAGFRLDVNGTMRVQSDLTVSTRLTVTTGEINSNQSSVKIYVNNSLTPVSFSSAGVFSHRVRLEATGQTPGNGDNILRVNIGLTGTTTGTYSFIHNQPTVSSYTNSGTVRGLYINLSAITTGTVNAIETVTGNILLGTTSGNVGIGTTSPTYKLHTVGTGRITGNVELSVDSGAYTFIGATGDTSYRLSVDGDLRIYGNIRTAQPTGGTGVGVWRLGSTATGTFTLDTTTCVEIEIGGSLIKLATVS